jgi:LPS O-antigen subunit length determinant protein (WzzB/FepE family)
MKENVPIQNEDEISLLDLFAMLLRYRKLIAGITLLFIMLAIAGYFIYPAYKYKKALATVHTQGIMQIEIVQKAQLYISQSLDSFINLPDIIYDSLYAAGMETFKYKGGEIFLNDENKTTVMYLINLFWIQNLDLDGNILVQKGQEHKKIFNVRKTGVSTGTNTSSVYEVTLKDKDSDMIKKFMEFIYKLCTVKVEENLRTNAEMMVNNYERLINSSRVSESMQMILEKDFDAYVFLKNFLDGKEVVVRLIGEPVIILSPVSLTLLKSQYKKTGIIIVFAGFFMAVMFAFALNTIRNIKNDEEAMKKIHDALRNSGGK